MYAAPIAYKDGVGKKCNLKLSKLFSPVWL